MDWIWSGAELSISEKGEEILKRKVKTQEMTSIVAFISSLIRFVDPTEKVSERCNKEYFCVVHLVMSKSCVMNRHIRNCFYA